MTIRELLRRAAHLLAEAGSEEADLEAELLLAHALGIDRVHLYQRLPEDVSPEQEQGFQALLDRRLAHEPTAYILGHREFYGLELEVTPAAIIPRPETEVLVELALAFIRPRVSSPEFRVVDVGVGSGAIAVALAANLPPAVQVIATDLSPEALALARRNAARHGLQDRIAFLQGDLLEPLDGPVYLIAANLPYVPTADWEQLPPEIRAHEPRAGLDGGPDGLRLIERLLRQAPAYLNPGGALFAEISDEQGEAARRLAAACFPNAAVDVKPDLSALDRVLVVRM
ncbi:MAG TPA: peptide chain release factor N(5)-glutamine methyltransferase [Dehalococcoidia bacterium]|nr:peptide chain release factor N(5)-glutamine methyltransferase [Dehalococcoidia bacterium]